MIGARELMCDEAGHLISTATVESFRRGMAKGLGLPEGPDIAPLHAQRARQLLQGVTYGFNVPPYAPIAR